MQLLYASPGLPTKFPPRLFNSIRLTSIERQLKKKPQHLHVLGMLVIQTLDLNKEPDLASIWSILLHCLCITSARACELTPRNCHTRSFHKRWATILLPMADGNVFLRKTQSFDATFLQQAELVTTPSQSQKKWSFFFAKNANRRGKTTHVRTSWPEGKTRYTAGSCPPAEDKVGKIWGKETTTPP